MIKVEQDWTPNCEQDCVWEDETYNKSSSVLANLLLLLLSSIRALM